MSWKPGDKIPQLSDADSRMDLLVQQASLPSLATLIERGKEAGYIVPQWTYAHPSV